jgi:hypothetical protein
MANNPFGGLKQDGLEETQDRLGGSYILDSGVYDMTVKLAYAIESANGAKGMVLTFDNAGREYRETIYVTNRQGENFFLNKDDKSKKVPLPGFTTVDDICLCATGVSLSEQDVEEKMVNVYDFDQRKELPKSVEVVTSLLGKPVTLGIIRILENKSEKNAAGIYEPIADEREVNQIDKVFHTETRLTTPEARTGMTAGEFYAKWAEKNTLVNRDQRKIKDGQAGKSGRPGASSGPPQATSQPTRTSLFSKK